MKPELVFSNSNVRIEVYFLNSGDRFAGFGGSEHPLIVADKASIVVRRVYGPNGEGGIEDSAADLGDAETWAWIRRMIGNSLLTLAQP